MKKISFVMVIAVIFLGGFLVGNAFAVSAPSVQERKEAEKGRQKDVKEKVKEQRASGCEYGKDVKTGKCYEPKEGQFYRDPKTGEVKVKGVKKINTPW